MSLVQADRGTRVVAGKGSRVARAQARRGRASLEHPPRLVRRSLGGSDGRWESRSEATRSPARGREHRCTSPTGLGRLIPVAILLGVALAVSRSLAMTTAIATTPSGPSVLHPERMIPPPLDDLSGFGATVAAHGDLVAIGAPRDGDDGAMKGSVWIHRLTAAPGATVTTTLLARIASGVDGDRFGGTVALSRPNVEGFDMALLAVGADWTDVGDAAFAGAVHLYTPTGPSSDSPSDLWSLQQTLVDAVPEAGAEFGRAVALARGSHDAIAVGAPRADVIDEPDAGRVTLFLRNMSHGQSPDVPHDPLPIATSFDVALSTIPFLAGVVPNAPPEHRAAETGRWSPAATVHSPTPSTSGWFGYAVAMEGSDLVIGEPGASAFGADGTRVSGAGAVHVYRLENGLPRHRATLRAPVAEHAAWFGLALDLRNGKLAVGAPRARDAGVPTGAVYLYDVRHLHDPMIEARLVHAPLAQPGLGFGGSIALGSGAFGADVLAIGASGFDLANAPERIEDAGAVWLVDPSESGASGPRWIARLAPDRPRPSGCLGHAVAFAQIGARGSSPRRTYAVSGHLHLEEESRAPSAGVALHRVPEALSEIEDRPPPELSPATGTTARRSVASPTSSRSR